VVCHTVWGFFSVDVLTSKEVLLELGYIMMFSFVFLLSFDLLAEKKMS